ncbi:hypothetical protein DXG01_006150 [Tephrocybe rancida]|nr:hypothetical protein DXG01_006150 [Tephrocybe rancida]
MIATNEHHTIHPNGDPTQCLDVRGGQIYDGTPAQIYPCNGSPSQLWKISRGTTTVQIDIAPFCLDAGFQSYPGGRVIISECLAGLPGQTWFYTPDNKIILKDEG